MNPPPPQKKKKKKKQKTKNNNNTNNKQTKTLSHYEKLGISDKQTSNMHTQVTLQCLLIYLNFRYI